MPAVLIVTASARRRGAEIQATQLATALRHQGWQIDVAALSSGTSGTPLPIRVLGRRRLTPATLWRLRRAARGADAVIAYGSSTLPACVIALARSGTPFVYRSISDPARWLRGPLHRLITRIQYRRPDTIVALWDAAARSISDVFGVSASKISIIPNARDAEWFRPPSATERAVARARFGLTPGRHAVGFIGSLTPEKRIDLALAAIALLPEHVLLVAGSGVAMAETQRSAERIAKGRVTFLGEVTDVLGVLHASDAIVITSDVEGMPGVAIEAALCGVPVVATPAGALTTMSWVQIVDRDPLAIARGLREACARGAADPVAVSKFTWPAVTTDWERVLAAVKRRKALGAMRRR
ncbi:MAG: glycosyltransferase family 4 protein [Actinomycetota bacterium]|nr:glycosyltransferase family 4 protein [Actinomycetota bacterium]